MCTFYFFHPIQLGGGDDKPIEKLDVIKIYGPFDTFDPSTDYVHDLILELTNVDVQYDFLPKTAIPQTPNFILTLQDKLNIIY